MNRLTIGLALSLWLGGVWLGPVAAFAHGRSVSYSNWQIEPAGARVTLRLSALELTRLSANPDIATAGPSGALPPALSRYLTDRLQLRASGRVCEPIDPPHPLSTSAGMVAFEWRVDCGGRAATQIHSQLFLDVAPGHLHFARLRGTGSVLLERVLTDLEPDWRIDAEAASAGPPAGTSLGGYVALGIEHIATGYDHLVFLLALLLLASRWVEIATIVSGFTLAHSITLALAVLGGLRPDSASVEALIGLSIALVASENAWLLAGRPRGVPIAIATVLLAMTALAGAGFGSLHPAIPAGLAVFAVCYFAVLARSSAPVRWRIAISFVFGLIHGFGFAGVLAEVELPADRLARALLGFNLGVEVGQLAIVAMLLPMLSALARFRGGRAQRVVIELGTAAVCGMGVYWLIARAYV